MVVLHSCQSHLHPIALKTKRKPYSVEYVRIYVCVYVYGRERGGGRAVDKIPVLQQLQGHFSNMYAAGLCICHNTDETCGRLYQKLYYFFRYSDLFLEAIFLTFVTRKCYSSLDAATDCGLGFHSCQGQGISLISVVYEMALEKTQPPPFQRVLRGAPSLWVQQPGGEANHSPASSAKAMHEWWSYTSTTTNIFMAS